MTENRKKKRKTGLKIRIALQNFKRFNDNKSNFCTSIYMIFYADEKKKTSKKNVEEEKKRVIIGKRVERIFLCL